MNEDIQEGVVPQTIDYDNLNLPDPDAKQEDDQSESEEQQETEEVTEEVNEETQEEVTEDVADSGKTDETATEESEGVDEVKETTNEVVEQTEVQESNPIFDVGAETNGVIRDLTELKEVSQVLSDPFFKKMYDYYKGTGDIKPFLQANSTDYSKMGDIDILRIKHQEDYKDLDLSQDVMDHLFQEEVLEKYNAREDDGLEGKVALAKLKKEANQARSAFVNTQNEFMAPTLDGQPKVDETEMIRQRNEQRKIATDQLKNIVKDNKLSVEIAEGVDALKLDVDPSKIVDAALNPMDWISKSIVKDGQPDWNKLSQLVAFSNDPQGFLENLYKHGNTLGQKKFVEKNLKNKPKVTGRKPTNSTAGLDPYSLEAFKNSSKIE
jgi:hypothetical protein